LEEILRNIANYFNVSTSTVQKSWLHRYKNELKKHGIITTEKRGGKEIIKNIDEYEFIKYFSQKFGGTDMESKAKVIGVANTKGGTGKTTLSNAIATYYSKQGLKTLVIDLDPQASQTLLFGINPDETINTPYDITNIFNDQEVIPLEIEQNLHIIPSNKTLIQYVESGKPFKELAVERAIKGSRRKRGLDESYDVIILDPPATNGVLMVATLIASDYIITPARLSFVDETGLRVFAQVLADVLENTRKNIKMIGIVPVEYEKNSIEHLITIKGISGYIPEDFMKDKLNKEIKEEILKKDYGFYDILLELEEIGLELPDRENFILPPMPKRQAWSKAMGQGVSIWDYIENYESRLKEDYLYKNLNKLMEMISKELKLISQV
jgi:chromosome partitioning protein